MNQEDKKAPKFTPLYEETGERYWFDISKDVWNWRLRFKGQYKHTDGRIKNFNTTNYYAKVYQVTPRLFEMLLRTETQPNKSLKEFAESVERTYQLLQKSTERYL